MTLTFVICSYKNTDALRLCLNSLYRNIQDVEYEILVVDSDTGEDTEMLMREEFPGIRFFPHTFNTGFGRLVNTGLRNARGKYIFVMNYDIIIPKDANFAKMVTYMESHSDVGVLGPKQLNFNNTLQYTALRFYRIMTIPYRRTFLKRLPFAKKHLDRFLMKDKDYTKIFEVDWLLGSALLVSRKALDVVGYMDEKRFFMYLEDLDWCRRFWEKGYKVLYFPHAYIYHLYGKASEKGGVLASLGNKMTWIHIQSGYRYFLKYLGKKTPVNH